MAKDRQTHHSIRFEQRINGTTLFGVLKVSRSVPAEVLDALDAVEFIVTKA